MFNVNTPVTIKAEQGRRVRFLGIGRRVEVGERSSVTVTIKSAPAGNRSTYLEILGPFTGRCPIGTRPMSACVPAIHMRYTAGCRTILTGRTMSDRASHTSGGRRAKCWTTEQSERCLVGARPVPDRYLDCLVCSKFVPAPARCVRCHARHRSGIGRFISDQFAMRNAAPGFKSELKVTRCPPDVQT